MEEGVGDINDDKSENNTDEREGECLDVTSPDDMKERVSDLK